MDGEDDEARAPEVERADEPAAPVVRLDVSGIRTGGPAQGSDVPDSPEGIGDHAGPKEPSARARMLTERWRREEPTPQPWGAPRPAPRYPSEPTESSNTWRAWVLGVLVVVALVVTAGSMGFSVGNGDDVVAAAPGPQSTISASDPFEDSPADTFAVGASGIVVPAGRPVGKLSAQQVEAAGRYVKKYLVAANVNRKTLTGRSAKPVIATIDPLHYPHSELRKSFDQPSAERDSLWFATRFDLSETTLGEQVRVRGTMKYLPTTTGALVVRTDYLFVYSFKAKKGDETTRIVLRRTTDFDTSLTRRQTPGTVWFKDTSREGGAAGAACDSKPGYWRPWFGKSDSGATEDPTAPPEDPYDMTAPKVLTGTCFKVKRV